MYDCLIAIKALLFEVPQDKKLQQYGNIDVRTYDLLLIGNCASSYEKYTVNTERERNVVACISIQ